MGPTNWCPRGPEGEVKKNKQAVRLTAQPRGAREGGTTRPAQGAPPPSSLLNGLAFCLPRPTRARASEFPCLRGHVPRAGPSGSEAPPVLTPCPQLDMNNKRTLLNTPGCFAPLCRCTERSPSLRTGKAHSLEGRRASAHPKPSQLFHNLSVSLPCYFCVAVISGTAVLSPSSWF